MADRKATLGVIGLSRVRVQINPEARYSVVGSPHPGRAQAAKGKGVHLLKRIVSWVQNGESQFGHYLLGVSGA